MNKSRTLILAATCTATGAAGALGAGAITSSAQEAGAQNHHRFGQRHGLVAAFRHAVHAEAVVPRPDNKFPTLTFDRGIVKKVSGAGLTITEGTMHATYKDDVTITLPADARIRRDHVAAALSDLQAGDRVAVFQAPDRTVVHAKSAHGATSPPNG